MNVEDFYKELYVNIVKPFNADKRYWKDVCIHETEDASGKEIGLVLL